MFSVFPKTMSTLYLAVFIFVMAVGMTRAQEGDKNAPDTDTQQYVAVPRQLLLQTLLNNKRLRERVIELEEKEAKRKAGASPCA